MARKSNGKRQSGERKHVLAEAAPTRILAIDIGGTKVKILATGQTEPRKAPSGKRMTPTQFSPDETLDQVLGRQGLRQLGKDQWRSILADAVSMCSRAFAVDYVVLGGGNAKRVKELSPGTRRGHNLTAFRGGFRLWSIDDVPTLAADAEQLQVPRPINEWRMI
jgi:hypothetical protein